MNTIDADLGVFLSHIIYIVTFSVAFTSSFTALFKKTLRFSNDR